MMPKLGPRRRTDPALTFAKLRDVYSPHCGIVTGIDRMDVRDRSLRGTWGYAVSLETATARRVDGRQGSRVAHDRTRAFVRAVGEALERYACTTYDPAPLVTAPWRDVRERALDPRATQLPSAEEYARLPGLTPFREDAPMRWAQGWRLPDGRETLVPAQMVWVLYNLVAGEPRLAGPTSTGWAIHHTREEAIHAALREVVERDSFFLAWLRKRRVPTLDLASVRAPDLRRQIASMQEGGAVVRVLVTTTDFGIPSFAVAAHDPRPGRPPFLLTLAAHPDPERGLRQALEEAAMMRLDFTTRMRTTGARPLPTMADVKDMADHAEYYLDRAHLDPVRWLLDEHAPMALDALPGFGSADVWEEALGMVARIAKAGHETLYVDATPPDLREAGWHAAKVLVPGSIRHEYGLGVRYLDAPRLYDGQPPFPLNPDPHPYS